ncbi:MAG: putative ABC transporter permease [Oscillospiraceae bacterium]
MLEKLFHTKWWDYSGMFCNINGRVCLQFSLIFGALSVVAVKLLYPPFSSLMAWIPMTVKPFLAWGLLAILVGDTTVTVISILRLNGKLAEMEKAMKEFQERLGHLPGELPTFSQWVQELKDNTARQKDSGLKAWMEATSKKVEAFLSQHGFQGFQVKRLSKAFPNMSSTKYKEQLDKLKERILDRKSKNEKENED